MIFIINYIYHLINKFKILILIYNRDQMIYLIHFLKNLN